jgi:hypothetical protein
LRAAVLLLFVACAPSKRPVADADLPCGYVQRSFFSANETLYACCPSPVERGEEGPAACAFVTDLNSPNCERTEGGGPICRWTEYR